MDHGFFLLDTLCRVCWGRGLLIRHTQNYSLKTFSFQFFDVSQFYDENKLMQSFVNKLFGRKLKLRFPFVYLIFDKTLAFHSFSSLQICSVVDSLGLLLMNAIAIPWGTMCFFLKFLN